MSRPEKFNYETTIESIRAFLDAHPLPSGKKYVLVMDNAPWHKKAVRLVQTEKLPEYADILEKVIFIKMPPYSPDLNPIEQVWRITRRENTHNVFFSSLSKLEEAVNSAFAKWAVPNQQLQNLCDFEFASLRNSLISELVASVRKYISRAVWDSREAA